MKTWKANLEETKKHYIDWWNRKGIVLNMWEHFQNGVTPHADVKAPSQAVDNNQKWFDPQWRAEHLDWYVAHSSLKADILPVANTHLGPGSLAAILGGVFEGGDDTIWIHPNPNFSDELKFDENNPNWQLHKELLRECKKKAAGNYYVGMPDLMEGLDVLAAMKGTDKVLLDTVMQPEVLEKQLRFINDVYFRVFDELYDIIREGDEMAFCYFSSWAPGKMAKLQSDISTMISVEDYRRFVQPYVREQCQKLEYTLYHLDGVGALHHLPAILEIEELDAIQWTPGVGEPQGGSPKWYNLYRQILDAGKSVMICWVTLDELRPLLDAIGGNGVHLEMDFHSEEDVEKAMEIVEEYRGKAPKESVDTAVENIINKVESQYASQNTKIEESAKDLYEVLEKRVLILDGATGTMTSRFNLKENDFRGERFANHSVSLKGNNDLLALTRPDVVADIHRCYLDAGADIITTDTFNAQRISMSDYRLEEYCREINLAACRIARNLADEYTAINPKRPRFVAGSVGPTNKALTIASEGLQPGWIHSGFDNLKAAYKEQILAQIEGGVDIILIETIFDLKNADAALEGARAAMKVAGRNVPIMLSFNVSNPSGLNVLGQNVIDYISKFKGDDILSVGLNCVADMAGMAELIGKLADSCKYRISFHPNAGLPDSAGHYKVGPKEFQAGIWPLLDSHKLNIVGGCCGTDETHIAALRQLVEPAEGLFLSPYESDTTDKSKSVKYKGRGEQLATNKGNERVIVNIPLIRKPSDIVNLAGKKLFNAIVEGKEKAAADATEELVRFEVEPQQIINERMITAMSEVGKRFQEGKAFVPQLLMAGKAMKAALEILKPMMAGASVTSAGKVVIGTVKGDLHDIGKNLVASMLEGCGFEVVNIGIDIDADTFVKAVIENDADILCMSALLTTTMTYMKTVIEALEIAGIRDKVKVMVGGAPVSEKFAMEIGADGYSDNANSAVELARKLMEVKN